MCQTCKRLIFLLKIHLFLESWLSLKFNRTLVCWGYRGCNTINSAIWIQSFYTVEFSLRCPSIFFEIISHFGFLL